MVNVTCACSCKCGNSTQIAEWPEDVAAINGTTLDGQTWFLFPDSNDGEGNATGLCPSCKPAQHQFALAQKSNE